MRQYLQEGTALDLIAPSGGVTAGLGYFIGAIFVVAATTAAVDETFVGYAGGVYELAAAVHATTQAIAAGAPVYYDTTALKCTATASGNVVIGHAVEAKVSTVALCKVKLIPAKAAAAAAIVDALTAGSATAALNATAINSILAALRLNGIVTP